jgi:hypothetical protein
MSFRVIYPHFLPELTVFHVEHLGGVAGATLPQAREKFFMPKIDLWITP